MEKEKRLIDANALRDSAFEMTQIEWNGKAAPISWAHAYETFIEEIENAPTVDAALVIRCKDCDWYKAAGNSVCGVCTNPHCTQSFYGCLVREWQFCYYGERTEE